MEVNGRGEGGVGVGVGVRLRLRLRLRLRAEEDLAGAGRSGVHLKVVLLRKAKLLLCHLQGEVRGVRGAKGA